MNLNKLKNKNYSNVSTLISAIIFFIIGSIIFSNPNNTIKLIAYILGGMFIVVGLFKVINYYVADKNNLSPSIKELSIGIIALASGGCLIIFSSAIEIVIRVTMGAWILFNGINLLTNSLRNKSRKSKVLIILALLMIFCGIYMILKNNLVFQMIGLFIIFYSVIEIIGYIYYVWKK